MNPTVYPHQESHPQAVKPALEPVKVAVTLLDWDNLPLARGTAVLPVLLGVGVFWPSCPMPPEDRLCTAKCFTLPTGESMNIKTLKLAEQSPPKYEFWVSHP
jgi:hypothetical protein